MSSSFSFAVCIPTYKRTYFLKKLVADLTSQTFTLNTLIVVDGFPSSGDVTEMLHALHCPELGKVVYIPSNHSNLSYQRYLGWRAAADLGVDILIYFDDDLRIYQRDVLEWLTRPFADDNNVVGVGCFSRVPESGHDPAMNHLMAKRKTHWLVQRFGSRTALDLKPGQLTPTGHRVELADNGQDYVDTDWLQGRVMAYRMSVMTTETFSTDLFALYEHRIGRAEDTFLSRRVGTRGRLLFTFRAVVEHPNVDTPKAYPYEAYNYAYTATYSRRFLNDYYRIYDPPTISDRWALLKSYAGNVSIAWMRAFSKPKKTNLVLARGTTLGALHGLTRPPSAKRLTPHINWWGDAEKALANAKQLQP